MAIRKFRTGQQSYNVSTYVGTYGTIFYDEAQRNLRVSDGITPGGLPVGIPLATSTTIGGFKVGPGIVIDSEGRLLIDSSGLEFSFGDFTSIVGSYSDSTEYALLSSIKLDEDIVIASNGAGSVKVVGQFDVYRTNGTVTGSLEDEEPFLRVKDDGQVRILVPGEDMLEGGVEIVGSLTGTYVPPGVEGTMLHMTGNPNVPCRVYQDTLGNYSSYVGRRYNGTVLAPTQVLAGEDIFRINATAATSAGMGSVSLAQISFHALENQTPTAQGSRIDFTVTPIGQPATNRVDVMNITVADGVSATKFTGPLVGTANIATTVTLVATNTTAATHYLTFVDSATGNENVRTDTDLTYNPGTNTLTAGAGAFTTFTGKYHHSVRDAGTIGAGGTLTVNFSTDSVVYCVWGDGMTLAYQNFTTGSIVKVIARKGSGTGVDTFSLGGLTAANVSSGSTTSPNVSADTTAFIELICTGTTIGSVYAKL